MKKMLLPAGLVKARPISIIPHFVLDAFSFTFEKKMFNRHGRG